MSDSGLVGTSSLYEEAFEEALRHKWIESQKHGRDLGDSALKEWYRTFWHRYCRCKQLEHLEGRCCWPEFGDENFGQLYSLIVQGDLLVDRVLDRYDAGFENLDIIAWAHEWGLSIKQVVNILIQIDMNRARLTPDRL